MKQLFLLLSSFIALSVHAQDTIGIFPFNKDIGSPKMKGSATYDGVAQAYTLKGGGYDVWYNRDEFRYLWKKMTYDFIVTANFELTGKEGNAQSKVGWMVRKEGDPASAHISTALHGDGLTVLQWRPEAGANMLVPQDERFFSKRNVQVMQLERRGDVFIMRAAGYGEPLQIVGYHEMKNMAGEVLVGLFVCAHDSNAIAEARVSNVRICDPVPMNNNPNPNRAWRVGSRLETIDIFNGKRKIVYQSVGRLESPNWMPGGKKILFNADGLLFTVPVAGGSTAEVLNTGLAKRINGAHCISSDGKMLGIGNSDGRWPNILLLPLSGGTPETVVNEMPAYLHGLSPDNKAVVFTAPRKDMPGAVYDIYKKSVNGGQAVRLTDSKRYEFADGCEYSPDGKYIYYNASQRGGTMQIWRMRPDGSGKEQLTFGAYNNWFPHISPDGKWMAFISFPPETRPNVHPAYASVTIRLMPVSGGAARVIAYLYGGQGSLDENSWSPDSRHLSFVSYTTL
ncbi:hypothetical protein [Compostibacter hankyongensis]|uniref:SMP-30/gluconolactonase/LRE family protein n=1 Tax=Compostibacter hankyongensis TaxID=1007089 RepID=A0ABP8FK00_9BACT